MAGKLDSRGILWDLDLEDMTEHLERWEQDQEAAESRLLRKWQDLRLRSEARALLCKGRDLYRDAVSSMIDAMDATCRKIPVPHGFFTEKEDRRIAVTEVCRLLTLLERQVQALREIVAFYGGVSAKLRDLLSALVGLEAQWMLFRSRSAADAVGSEAEKRLPLEALQAERASVEGALEEIGGFCDGGSYFCQNTWPSFCLESSKASDIVHNGDRGQIGTLLQVLGSFRGAVEGLPHAPETYDI